LEEDKVVDSFEDFETPINTKKKRWDLLGALPTEVSLNALAKCDIKTLGVIATVSHRWKKCVVLLCV